MDPIIVEVITPESFPYGVLFTTITAIAVALITGVGAYFLHNNLLNKNIAEQRLKDAIDRKIQVLQITLIPLRDETAKFQSAMNRLAASQPTYQSFNDDLEGYAAASRAFATAVSKVTDPKILTHTSAIAEIDMEITAPYLGAPITTQSQAELYSRLLEKRMTLTLSAVRINSRIEELLSGQE
jgi:hypothetical protein